VRFHAAISLAALVGEMKGASSFLINTERLTEERFRWQGGYGAFTLWREDTPSVERYIIRQKEHHRAGALVALWESTSSP
jgi:hypothetical protein